MRIIAGRYRSRQIVAPTGDATRPTSDRLRETLFNVLAPRIVECVFLDLFSGSGAIGIEALSRGARQVYAIDHDKRAARAIEKNIETLEIGDELVFVQADVTDGLRTLAADHVQFDIAVLDPPYREHAVYEQSFRLIGDLNLAAPGAILVAEHEKHFDPGDQLCSFTRYRTLKQGDAVLSFYR
ncbi:MAG TPA: 16S rRNA (guanine(966)-N(2))-methyltransferase RsmD [Terriglobales bacterium]|nr:16S rRNA (guanine(966)-N(2))-methyltransferase RsmD [Terriglobales bacterium]